MHCIPRNLYQILADLISLAKNNSNDISTLQTQVSNLQKQVNNLTPPNSGTFILSLSGPFTTTITVTYLLFSNYVILNLGASAEFTASVNVVLTGTLPSQIIPTLQSSQVIQITSNNVATAGLVEIKTSGAINFYPTPNGGYFSGTSAINQTTVTYLL